MFFLLLFVYVYFFVSVLVVGLLKFEEYIVIYFKRLEMKIMIFIFVFEKIFVLSFCKIKYEINFVIERFLKDCFNIFIELKM